MDENEAGILSAAEKHFSDERAILDEALRTIALGSKNVRERVTKWLTDCEAVALEPDLEPAIEAVRVRSRGEETLAIERRKRAEAQLNLFSRSMGIVGEPAYPESLWHHFGIVGVMLVFETAMNATFYRNEQGLIGGAAVALVVSLLNLGTAVALGILFRYKNLADRPSRILGWGALTLAIILAIFLNALFATFRSEYTQINPDNFEELRNAFARAASAASRVFVGEIPTADFMSFLLFGFGLLLSAFAIYKGYSAFDRYPGRQALSESCKAAVADVHRLEAACDERVGAFLRGKAGRVDSLLAESSHVATSVAALEAQLAEATGGFDARNERIRSEALALVSSYREENIHVRTTAPPPYFAKPPLLPVDSSALARGPIESELRAIIAGATAARREHSQMLSARLAAITRASNLALTEQKAVYRKGLEAEADERINASLVVKEQRR